MNDPIGWRERVKAALVETERVTGVPVAVITGRPSGTISRKRIGHARQVAGSLLRSEGLTYAEIGRVLGIHHATVLHHLGRLKRNGGTNANHDPGRSDD